MSHDTSKGPTFSYLEAVQGRWKLLRSGWASSNLPPLVEIGLTGLPNMGGQLIVHPAHPSTTPLQLEGNENTQMCSWCTNSVT